MKFYYFGGGDHTSNNKINLLEKSGFSGVLFTYDCFQGDYFVKIARDMKPHKKIIYMVAIRPHALSPQYLTMITNSLNQISPGRVQINLIAGHIKDHEKKFGGILGDISDSSTNIERSNNLIEYLKELDNMKNNNPHLILPDLFVTTTNEFVFDVANKLKNKVIIPYSHYKRGHWTIYTNYPISNHGRPSKEIDISETDVMISLSPIIRETQEEIDSLDKKKWTTDTEYFTYSEFYSFIKKIEDEGIKYLMMHAWPENEEDQIIKFMNSMKEFEK